MNNNITVVTSTEFFYCCKIGKLPTIQNTNMHILLQGFAIWIDEDKAI